jgi:hypothetical protein
MWVWSKKHGWYSVLKWGSKLYTEGPGVDRFESFLSDDSKEELIESIHDLYRDGPAVPPIIDSNQPPFQRYSYPKGVAA